MRANNALVFSFKVVVIVSLLGSLVAISQSSLVSNDDDLVRTALAIDFLFTVPIIYFFLIRKTSIPPITVVPVFLASFALASLSLPDGIGLISVAGWVLVPTVELLVFGYLIFRIYRTRRAYQDEANQFDLMERLRNAFVRELKPPFIAQAAAFEVAILAFAFLKWRRPKERGFSYHRTNGSLPTLAVFLFLLVAETVGLHFLLSIWSSRLAWIVTALSIYFIVQIVAHLKALYLRPIVVTRSSVFVRCGILGDAVIRRESVESAEIVNGADDVDGIDLLPLGGMSQPNVRLTLTEPAAVNGLYGFESRGSVVRLYLDDPTAFRHMVLAQAPEIAKTSPSRG